MAQLGTGHYVGKLNIAVGPSPGSSGSGGTPAQGPGGGNTVLGSQPTYPLGPANPPTPGEQQR